MIYRKYSEFLKQKYGEKVYKLPIKLKGTWPNRDGSIGDNGCSFCGDEGGSFENLEPDIPIADQLAINKNHISKKYNAKKFIAYFQNYTNTYFNINKFKKMINQAIDEDIVAIYISTRPDCIDDEQLEYLKKVKEKYKIDIVIELGLQTANYKVLYNINRGHGLAEFIDAVIRCNNNKIDICTHIIIGLPDDKDIDIIETAKIISALKIQQVKIHALYILKNSVFGKMYESGKLETIGKDEFIDRVILFLRYLDPSIVIQRLIGRSSEEDSLFSNWSTSWWKIQDEILNKMTKNGYRQGDLFNYLIPKRSK